MVNLKNRLKKLEQRTTETARHLPVGNIYDSSMTAEEINAFLENII